MRYLILIIALSLFSSLSAQVAINTDGSAADASAMLDVKSTTRGMLVPRMTKAQRDAISSPATGLMIYQTDDVSGFYFYSGSGWVLFSGGAAELNDLSDARTGGMSVFLGEGSGINDDLSDNENTYTGYQSGYSTTTGQNNAAFGSKALYSCVTGKENTATGSYALYKNTGNYNSAFGFKTMYNNINGQNNTAVGQEALYSNQNGWYNTAMGTGALYYNTGNSNSSFGHASLQNNTSGSNNNAFGQNALYNNKVGNGNTAFGYSSQYNNVSGDKNIALGESALYSNTSADSNTAVGYETLMHNTVTGNTGLGIAAGYYNSSGDRLTAVGYQALYSNTTGDGNTAVGYRALYSNSSSSFSTALGSRALANSTGANNTATGFRALYTNTTGGYNVANGNWALYLNESGSENVAVGVKANYNLTSGNYNTSLGFEAYYYGNYSNSTALGHGASITQNNMVKLGNNDVTWIGGHSPWYNTSDGRFKKEVTENVAGIDFIMKLRPVTYTWDTKKLNRYMGIPDSVDVQSNPNRDNEIHTGFIAQEVEQAASEAGFVFDGIHHPANKHDPYSLAYAEFVVPLVKATQEQQKIIEALQKENIELKKQLERIEKLLNTK